MLFKVEKIFTLNVKLETIKNVNNEKYYKKKFASN